MRVDSPPSARPARTSPSPIQPSWIPGHEGPAFHPLEIAELIAEPRRAVSVVVEPGTGRLGVGVDGTLALDPEAWPALAHLPPMYPEWLGDRGFGEAHGVRFPYVVGAMANGIATVEVVEAAARAGFLGFFGAAGLSLERISAALDRLEALDHAGLSWGSNLIHSPQEPALEAAVVDLYLRRGVRRVSASAFMDLTPALVRYAASGVERLPDGRVHRPNRIFAKISRPEVASRFLAPPPVELLERLVVESALSAAEAEIARGLPVAEDVTVESDSGGHTDNQPLGALFPTIMRLRDRAVSLYGYARPIRVGAAGGLGTPAAVASAFALGAAYVLTGSVNQACVESGLSEQGKQLLAVAELSDVTMAPAADMFEMGVEVQVLKRGTLFAQRGHHLRALYRRYGSIFEIPAEERARIEKSCFRKSLDAAWEDCRRYWLARDKGEVERAERDPKHQLALLFRAYLGQASRWAIDGVPDRAVDYQIWCGPAMGAFNDWVKGSFLEPWKARTIAQVGLNLIEGAAVIARAHQLRALGVPVPASAFDFLPRPLVAGAA